MPKPTRRTVETNAVNAERRFSEVAGELERVLRLEKMLSDHRARLESSPKSPAVKACLEVSAGVLKTLNGEVAALSQAYQSAYETACEATATMLDERDAA